MTFLRHQTRLRVLLWALWGICLPSLAASTVTDDNGSAVTLENPAQRMIAVSPHLAELVHAAGAGEHLVAAVRGADFPAEVRGLPLVGDAAGLDFERMLLLAPDLVLAWGSGNRRADIDRIRASGVAVAVTEPRALGDIARHLRMVGRLAGSEAVADAAAQDFDRRLQQLRGEHAAVDTVEVFVEIWHQPVFTIGNSHLLNDVLHTCGARNALEYPLLAGPVPLEDVLQARADVILSLSGQPQADVRARWRRLLGPSGAGRDDHEPVTVISIVPDLLTRPGPRILDGVQQLCGQLQRLRKTRFSEDRAGAGG